MDRTRAVRWISLVGAVTAVPTFLVAAPASAAQSVHIEAETSFSDPVSPFTSDLDGCEAGDVENGRFTVPENRGLGTFSGVKEFTCLEDDVAVGGFSVRLTAHFPVGPGSIGWWSVVDSWGTVDGLRANGKLVGFGNDDGLLDVYDGTIRR